MQLEDITLDSLLMLRNDPVHVLQCRRVVSGLSEDECSVDVHNLTTGARQTVKPHELRERLNCETNTPIMMNRIKRAWREQKRMRGAVSLVFEHGQWWVQHVVTGAAWSVNDAVLTSGVHTFSFEQVSQGEDA